MAAVMILKFLLACAATALAEIEMEFVKWPESVTAPMGDVVTFDCTVRVPGERLFWRWKPSMEDRSWHDLPSPGDEKVSSRLTVEVKDHKQAGYYQCVVSYGAVSLASVPGRLTIAWMELTHHSAQRRVISCPARNNVVIHCLTPLSDPPPTLTWFKEEKGKSVQLETPHGVLYLQNVSIEDTGTYSCLATNKLSGQTLDLLERVYLKIQHEGRGGSRFLESEDYVGALDNDGVLTASVPPNGVLRLWCGLVGTPPPRITWTRDNGDIPGRARWDGGHLLITSLRSEDEGVYSCSGDGIRRSWKVVSLQPAEWDGSAGSVNGTEGGAAKVTCGSPVGEPKPKLYWMLNSKSIADDKSVRTIGSELIIDKVEKRHAGIVQCFACNPLGCAYDAALLTVFPVQISDQQYSAEAAKNVHYRTDSPKRHSKKNNRKNKAVLVRPSKPNVTRMSDESVMLSWSTENQGLSIQFFKVQYRELHNASTMWHTESNNIPNYIHSYEVCGLKSDRFYEFRIAAVYSNQDNKQGRSSNRFYLARGGFRGPKAPTLTKATALSSNSILLNWTWSGEGSIAAEGFYVYYRAVTSAGEYEKVTCEGGAAARSIVLPHLEPDTAYELKLQAFTAQAPSDFTSIMTAKTLRPANMTTSSSAPPRAPEGEAAGSGALATAGGAGAAAVALTLVALLLCRRARRLHRTGEYNEKGSVPEGGGPNGYLASKVPITITTNPMHTDSGDRGVEMSYIHNNNTGAGVDDATLPHQTKNGSSRQFV